MKTNKIWYLGYVIGLCSLILALTLNLNEAIKVLLIFVFAISVSVSHIQLTHHRLLAKDRDYNISVNDERNEKNQRQSKCNDGICTYAPNGNYCSCLYCSTGILTCHAVSYFARVFSNSYDFYQ